MSILSNLYAGELMSIAKLSNVDRYENMSRKQRENIITTSAAFIPRPAQILRSRARPRPRPRLAIRFPPIYILSSRRTAELLSIDVDELVNGKNQANTRKYLVSMV